MTSVGNPPTVCNVNATCLEEICQSFTIPAPGNTSTHTLGISSGASTGTVDFSFAVTGSSIGNGNDFACDAIDFGVITSGTTAGVFI